MVAKKWHVAKRLTAAIRRQTRFRRRITCSTSLTRICPIWAAWNDAEEARPASAALLRLLVEQFRSNRLVICLDPAALYLIEDLMGDKADTRLLLIEAEFDDDYVRGHLGRVGLASAQTARRGRSPLSRPCAPIWSTRPTACATFYPDGFHTIAPWRSPEENAAQLARFLMSRRAGAGRGPDRLSVQRLRRPPMPVYDPQNIFARIPEGETRTIPCWKPQHTLAFRDIRPQAPVHVLVIPKGAYVSYDDFATNASDAEIVDFQPRHRPPDP